MAPNTPAQHAAQQVAHAQAELQAKHSKVGERMAALKLEIQALDLVRRKVFVDQAIALMTERGLYTPVIRRRAEQGDPLHGPLGAMVVKCYPDANFGAGWEPSPSL